MGKGIEKQKLGRKGEDIARRYLQRKGYGILETNWTYEKAEIDIIAEKNDLVVFVEVKTRSDTNYGEPEDAVGDSKEKNMMLAAEEYIELMGIQKEIRFDIISIVLADGAPRIHHIPDFISPWED